MKKYSPLTPIALEQWSFFSQPGKLPEIVHEDDPASYSMMDFRQLSPLTVKQDHCMYEARLRMEAGNHHIVLVIDEAERLMGVLSLEKILSAEMVKLIEDQRVDERKLLPVKDVMKPRDEVLAIPYSSLEYAKVGNVIKTLQQNEQPYALVVETDENQRSQFVRGYFHVTNISRQIGSPIEIKSRAKHSVADLVNDLS